MSSSLLFYYSKSENKSNIGTSEKIHKAELIKAKEIEKESVINELEDLKKTYDDIISNNKKISSELIQERDKVMKLMGDLAMIKGSEFSLTKYKSQVKILQERLKFLLIENVKLKEQNELISEERDSAKVGLIESEKRGQNLKKDLVNAVEKGSKLIVSNATVVSFKLKNSGGLVITDKANRVNGINVSFMIPKNDIAKSIEKVYFVQVINGENVVVGDINKGVYQYKTLTYSFPVNVKYEKKEINVSENFLGNKFTKGTYYVNIFDKEELVEETTFTLK